jgi:hypothetical protein
VQFPSLSSFVALQRVGRDASTTTRPKAALPERPTGGGRRALACVGRWRYGANNAPKRLARKLKSGGSSLTYDSVVIGAGGLPWERPI